MKQNMKAKLIISATGLTRILLASALAVVAMCES